MFLKIRLEIHYCRAIRADTKPERKFEEYGLGSLFKACAVLCGINSLQISVSEAVTTSKRLFQKKTNKGEGTLRAWNFQEN